MSALPESKGIKNRLIEFVSKTVATGEYLQDTIVGASEYELIDGMEGTETQATIRYLTPSGVIAETETLTFGTPVETKGYDAIEFKIDNNQGAPLVMTGHIRLFTQGVSSTSAGAPASEVTEKPTPPQQYGVDAAGSDAYTTLITPSSDKGHLFVSLEGSNNAIISVNGGTTDHIYMIAGTVAIFDAIEISNAVTIQGKNATPGSNYTNLRITIW